MSSERNKISRRHFLHAGGFASGLIFSNPFDLIVKAMTDHFIQQAVAEETKQLGARNYINIGLLGAPLRYQFDHWVRTKASDPEVMFNLMTATKFKTENNKVNGVELGYFDYKGQLVPHLFTQSVTTSAGSQPLTDLLNNMLVIRGYGTGVDGHPTNFVRQTTALGGAPTISGLSADNNSKTFDAVQWPNRGGYGSFYSAHGKSLTLLSDSKPLHNLLEGFGVPPADQSAGLKVKSRNTEAFELAKQRLNTYIKSDKTGSKILAQNHSQAVALMKKGINNLEGFWSEAVPRYLNIIQAAVRTENIAGISDKELNPVDNAFWAVGDAAAINLNVDSDLRTASKMATISNFAEGLALAEYLIKENLGSALETHFSNVENLVIKRKDKNDTEVYNQGSDMHATGCAAAVFIMNQYYRGISAGMLELINQLKKTKVGNTDLWSETLIHVVSDFGRSARADGSGSDHGFNQMISSVFSGCINEGPYVVGNVLATGGQAFATSIDGYNQKGSPTPVMMTSTVASLLRVPKNPFANLAEPLVSVENGKIVLKYPGKVKDA